MFSDIFDCVCIAMAGAELANFIHDVAWGEKDPTWDLMAVDVFVKNDIKVSLVY